ncbi:MAG: gluconate 2-dehydrogenase subunit 3 family protein [Thermomicrobiales bacterium]
MSQRRQSASEPGRSPAAQADVLRAFVDVMIPGDRDFPSASAAGTHGLLAERLRERGGAGEVDALVEALDRAAGAEFATLDRIAQTAAVAALQASDPVRFGWTRTVLYFSYYQHPLVIEAIRGMGFVYNDTPMPDGYALLKFDLGPGGNMPPANVPGWYKKTDEIGRIDLGPLAATLERELGR